MLATSPLSPHIVFQCKRFMTDKYMKQVGMHTSLPRKSAQDQLPPGCGVVFWVWVQSASTFRDKVGGSTPPWSVFFLKRGWVGGWACMAKTCVLSKSIGIKCLKNLGLSKDKKLPVATLAFWAEDRLKKYSAHKYMICKLRSRHPENMYTQ